MYNGWVVYGCNLSYVIVKDAKCKTHGSSWVKTLFSLTLKMQEHKK